MTELPRGWSYSRLDEVATIIRGVTYSSKDVLATSSPDAVMLLRATNIQNGVLDLLEPVWVPRTLVKPQQMLIAGDVVIASSSGSIQIVGKSASVKSSIDATFGAFCTTVRAESIDPGYLAHYLQDPTLRQRWSDLAGGSNINNLKSTDIAATPIPVPPLAVQKRIVEALDTQLSRLDKALVDLDFADSQSNVFKRSILNSLLTPQSSVSDSTLGRMNDKDYSNWHYHALGDLVTEVREHAKPAKDLTYELWSVPSYSSGRPEYAIGSTIQSSKLFVSPGDVLISKINPRINRVWLVAPSNRPQICSTEWFVARIKDCRVISPEFLLNYLQSPVFREWITNAASSVTGSHMRAKSNQILRQLVPVPPVEEQRRIVEVLDEQLSKLDSARIFIASQKASLQTLRRSLLNKAFTGELGTD